MATTFDPDPFAEGRFRLAYKGIYTEPPSQRGRACVVKENKSSYTWKATDWDKTVEIYKRAKDLATVYSSKFETAVIEYVDVNVYRVITKSSSKGPRQNEYVVVEDYIPGNFVKWCNNYGYISPSSTHMPAFMHWSWVHSGGEIMIADLQGVKTQFKYVLTDPAILSNTEDGGHYGCTDTGVEGMAMFFLKHTCNEFCNDLPKPTVQDILTTESARLQIDSTLTSTAYSHEIKIPEYLRKRMVSVFTIIATSA